MQTRARGQEKGTPVATLSPRLHGPVAPKDTVPVHTPGMSQAHPGVQTAARLPRPAPHLHLHSAFHELSEAHTRVKPPLREQEPHRPAVTLKVTKGADGWPPGVTECVSGLPLWATLLSWGVLSQHSGMATASGRTVHGQGESSFSLSLHPQGYDGAQLNGGAPGAPGPCARGLVQ